MSIKYFIYRGLPKSQFIELNGDVVPTGTNGLITHIRNEFTSFYNQIPNEPAPVFQAKFIGYPDVNTPYCSYSFTIEIFSNYPVAYQLTLMDDLNNVLIIPSTVTIQPGVLNTFTITVIPQSPFTGGITNWTLQGALPGEFDYEYCFFYKEVEVPSCEGFGNKITYQSDISTVNTILEAQEIKIYPNPAKEDVTISYKLNTSNAVVEIFDLSGRIIIQNVLPSNNGLVQLPTSNYQAGIYIVVVKENDNILLQQKLIIE